MNVDDKKWYGSALGYDNNLTRQRLIEIKECGMTEGGQASFKYEGAMSGLYIEKVWSYNDKDWKSYMDWVRDRINNLKNNKL